MVDGAWPTATAIDRNDQCVACRGVVSSVSRIVSAISSSPNLTLRSRAWLVHEPLEPTLRIAPAPLPDRVGIRVQLGADILIPGRLPRATQGGIPAELLARRSAELLRVAGCLLASHPNPRQSRSR
jgi:hypothetical protein